MTRTTVRVWDRFRSGQYSLDCLTIDDEASGGFFGVVTNVASDEPRALGWR